MIRTLSVLSMLVLCAGLAGAAQFEGFNYANDAAAQADWTVIGDYASAGNAAPAITASLADKQEGTSALKIEYTYNSSWYYFAGVKKTFATPVDVSAGKKFTIQVKAGDNVGADMWVIFKFKSSNGYNARNVVWSGFPGGNTWAAFSFTLNGYDGWDNHSVNDQVDLTDIAEFSISLMKTDGTSASGTATLLVDDMQIISEAPEVQEGVIDSFSYTDDAAAAAAWAPISTAAVTSVAAGKDGRGLQIAATNMASWGRYGAARTFASPVDMSAVGYFQVFVKGLSSNSPGPRLYMYLKDASGQKARVVFSSCMQADRWLCYRIIASFAPATAPAGAGDGDGFYGEIQDAGDWNSAVQPFHQDKWDGGVLTDMDLAQIVEVQFILETGTEGESATVQLDSLVAAPLAGLDQTSVPAWELFD